MAASPAEQGFGLPPPRLSVPKPPERMTAGVVAVSLLPRGVPLITLANGQQWVGVEATSRDLPLRAGDTVTVRAGAFGSFLMTGSESGHRSIRVERVQ